MYKLTQQQYQLLTEAYQMLTNRILEVKVTEENIIALNYILGRLKTVIVELQKSEETNE